MNKFTVGDCTVYQAKCLDVMPMLHDLYGDFDVACDPPYGIEEIVGGYGRGGRTIENDKDLSTCHELLEWCFKNIPHGWVAAFYSARVTPAFMAGIDPSKYFGEIIWNKKAPGMGTEIRYQHENIALFKMGEPPKLKDTFSVLTDYRAGKVHPHEKPVSLMQKIITALPSQLIVDPFMGSGSTGVAAIKSGKKFVGIEMTQQYFDIACQRLQDAYAQPDLFF